MRGTLAKVSTLFSTVGSAQRPCSMVRGGLTRGMPRLPRWKLSGHCPRRRRSAGAHVYMDPEGEVCAHDVIAQKTVLLRLGNGRFQPGSRQRILPAPGHKYTPSSLPTARPAIIMPLQHAVGVTLHNGAVHETHRDRPRRRCRRCIFSLTSVSGHRPTSGPRGSLHLRGPGGRSR